MSPLPIVSCIDVAEDNLGVQFNQNCAPLNSTPAYNAPDSVHCDAIYRIIYLRQTTGASPLRTPVRPVATLHVRAGLCKGGIKHVSVLSKLRVSDKV